MAHIPPLDMDSHPELQPVFASAAAAMGFTGSYRRHSAALHYFRDEHGAEGLLSTHLQSSSPGVRQPQLRLS